jgi:purine nucleoside permease
MMPPDGAPGQQDKEPTIFATIPSIYSLRGGTGMANAAANLAAMPTAADRRVDVTRLMV